MMNEIYKGEKPENALELDKVPKTKFYKKPSFWVAMILATAFLGCSVYGFYVGSQYAKAMKEATSLVAESKEAQSEALRKEPQKLPGTGSTQFDISVEYVVSSGTPVYYALDGSYTDSPTYGVVYWRVYSNLFSLVYRATSDYQLSAYDYIPDLTYNFAVNPSSWVNFYPPFTPSPDTPLLLSGTFYRQPFIGGSSQGYTSGYDSGYDDGYEEGYSDGSDAINVNQYFRVVMPVGNDSVQYESFIDGVSSDQGQIVGGSTSPNYREFTRNRNQTLRVDLTLPENYRAFWSYTPSFTSAFPVDDNVSLQQSWAVDGVTYLPTWVGSVQLWVGVTSASVPDLTYRTISVAFDVAHWGDIKVGAYQDGYKQGYVDGQEDPVAYDNGYNSGYSTGYEEGHDAGYNQAVADGEGGALALRTMFVTAFQQPFDQLYRFLNFNLLGINFLALFSALVTISLFIWVIKKVI